MGKFANVPLRALMKTAAGFPGAAPSLSQQYAAGTRPRPRPRMSDAQIDRYMLAGLEQTGEPPASQGAPVAGFDQLPFEGAGPTALSRPTGMLSEARAPKGPPINFNLAGADAPAPKAPNWAVNNSVFPSVGGGTAGMAHAGPKPAIYNNGRPPAPGPTAVAAAPGARPPVQLPAAPLTR